MAAKKRIFVTQKRSRDQILKNHFSKEFVNKIWLKVEEHEYIIIFDIKFGKKNNLKNGGQNKFCDIAQ